MDDVVELVSANVLIAAGGILLAPLILPVITRGLRPAAKGTIKGYLAIQDKVKEVAAATSEQMSDLVAEVQAEHTAAVAGATATAE